VLGANHELGRFVEIGHPAFENVRAEGKGSSIMALIETATGASYERTGEEMDDLLIVPAKGQGNCWRCYFQLSRFHLGVDLGPAEAAIERHQVNRFFNNQLLLFPSLSLAFC